MAQLAIRGHETRGKEVIETLEMLGGVNKYRKQGDDVFAYYYIGDSQYIYSTPMVSPTEDLAFTLEEFLKKYPHRVGDKVLYKHNKTPYFIRKMFWEKDNLLYELSDEVYSDGNSLPDTLIFDVSIAQLQPYKEETMEEKGTLTQIDLTRELCVADEVEVILGDYEFMLKDGKTYFVKKKPQYPKTYEECVQILLERASVRNDIGYKGDLLIALQRLVVCRDAYWKIAGEQMGLGKSWKPDWLNIEQDKFVLYTHNNVICINRFVLGHNVLAFPTAEMRDAFFENFKELIELCKEFL